MLYGGQRRLIKIISESTAHLEPVIGKICRAGDEFFFACFDLDSLFLDAELDRHFGFLSAAEVPEFSQQNTLLNRKANPHLLLWLGVVRRRFIDERHCGDWLPIEEAVVAAD